MYKPTRSKTKLYLVPLDFRVIPPKSHITLQLSVKNCLNINFLEHVQAKITLTSQRRGDIQINLISPAGTKVTLLTPRYVRINTLQYIKSIQIDRY